MAKVQKPELTWIGEGCAAEAGAEDMMLLDNNLISCKMEVKLEESGLCRKNLL